MISKRSLAVLVGAVVFLSGLAFCETLEDVDASRALIAEPSESAERTLEDSWNDFLHYTAIGRLDLAKMYAEAIIASDADPVELLRLSESNPAGYEILQKVHAHSEELQEVSGQVIDIIERGRFALRTDPKIIITEIERLSSTARGRLTAMDRLQNAGEYPILYMLDALGDDDRREEWPNIIWALPQIGRSAIRPLVAALQTNDSVLKLEIVKALGKIGYDQPLGYLKYIVENDESSQLRSAAMQSMNKINPQAVNSSAAELFYRLGESYYYHAESLAPSLGTDFANVWFWDVDTDRIVRKVVSQEYFNELMAMRACEWALRADAGYGAAIGLWVASFFKAESAGIAMPDYFGDNHADAGTYATTAGAEYLHQALARAIKDKNSYVALNVVEALATTAGEASVFYRLGMEQPLIEALSFEDRAVRYSAAIAIAAAGPKQGFNESGIVVERLVEALNIKNAAELDEEVAADYALRAAGVMLKLAQVRNEVIDLSAAQEGLSDVTKGSNAEMQLLAGQTLAWLGSAAGQDAIAAMAVNDENPLFVRIEAFNALGLSGKLHGNLLGGEKIDAIYELVSSEEIEPELRQAAAVAYGSLNLPSKKVKELILDQAKI